MSIFSAIKDAIFGGAAHADTLTPEDKAKAASSATPTAGAASAAPRAAMQKVDVAAVLDKLEDDSDETDIQWRKSIVDLMKLLKLDSSFKARKELATELKYTGDMGDSATMNVWLHKQVMTKLAENGGVVPAELKH